MRGARLFAGGGQPGAPALRRVGGVLLAGAGGVAGPQPRTQPRERGPGARDLRPRWVTTTSRRRTLCNASAVWRPRDAFSQLPRPARCKAPPSNGSPPCSIAGAAIPGRRSVGLSPPWRPMRPPDRQSRWAASRPWSRISPSTWRRRCPRTRSFPRAPSSSPSRPGTRTTRSSLRTACGDTPGAGIARLAHIRWSRLASRNEDRRKAIAAVEATARRLDDRPLLGQALTAMADELLDRDLPDAAGACFRDAITTLSASRAPALAVWPRRALLRASERSDDWRRQRFAPVFRPSTKHPHRNSRRSDFTMPTYTATALPARRARTPLNWRAALLCLAPSPAYGSTSRRARQPTTGWRRSTSRHSSPATRCRFPVNRPGSSPGHWFGHMPSCAIMSWRQPGMPA